MSCHNLLPDEIALLTDVLQLLPNEDAITYHSRVSGRISRLSSHLKRPNRMSRLFSCKSSTSLCSLHKPLNVHTINSLFSSLALEVSVHLNSLVHHSHVLPNAQRVLISRLRSLHILWLSPRDYAKTFLEAPSTDQWTYQQDGCEACILARVGGDQAVLVDLLTAVLSRSRKGTRHRSERRPTLLTFVEEWIDALPLSSAEHYALHKQIFKHAQALKKIEKTIHRGRPVSFERSRPQPQPQPQAAGLSQKPRDDASELPNRDTAGATQPNEEEEHDLWEDDIRPEEDPESEIIDHYAALMSTPHLPSLLARTESGATLVEPDPANTPRAPGIKRSRNTAASEPRYSRADEPLHSTPQWSASIRTAEDRARSYQNLLTTQPALRSSSPRSFQPIVEDQEVSVGTWEQMHAAHPDRMPPFSPSRHCESSITNRLASTRPGGTTWSAICEAADAP